MINRNGERFCTDVCQSKLRQLPPSHHVSTLSSKRLHSHHHVVCHFRELSQLKANLPETFIYLFIV